MRYRDDDGQLRRVEAAGLTRKAAERHLKQKLAGRGTHSAGMAYRGLIFTNAALGEGVETHLFFTFWGLT